EPHRCEIDHAICILECRVEHVQLTDVSAIGEHGAARVFELGSHVGSLAASKVVVDRDSSHVRREQLLDDVAADETGATDHDNVLSSDVHWPISCTRSTPGAEYPTTNFTARGADTPTTGAKPKRSRHLRPGQRVPLAEQNPGIGQSTLQTSHCRRENPPA